MKVSSDAHAPAIKQRWTAVVDQATGDAHWAVVDHIAAVRIAAGGIGGIVSPDWG